MPAAKTRKKARAKAPAVNVVLSTFDLSYPRPVYRRLRGSALAEFAAVGRDEYAPSGSTPLLDACSQFIGDLAAARSEGSVTVGLLLDESGSMSGNRDAVIAGVNEFVEGLRGVESPDPDAAGKVLAVVATDGFENASREVTIDQLRAAFAQREAEGWTFIFLGANQDAWLTGTSYGLSGTASGQTVSTPNTPTGALMAMREVRKRGVGYVSDWAATSDSYSAQGMANTSLAEDGTVTAADVTGGGAGAAEAPEPYGDVEGALERAKKATGGE